MIQEWDTAIGNFIELAAKHKVRMLMVGGGAVNFHGYQRYSADVDFWIDTLPNNSKKLILVFKEMDYHIKDFPLELKEQRQNISVKFSPNDLDLKLITNSSINKSFDDAYERRKLVKLERDKTELVYRVISLEDLITSKIKFGCPKDLLDVQQLQKIHSS